MARGRGAQYVPGTHQQQIGRLALLWCVPGTFPLFAPILMLWETEGLCN